MRKKKIIFGLFFTERIRDLRTGLGLRQYVTVTVQVDINPEGTIILGDNLVLVEWEGEPSAVRIKSRTFAQNYKAYFDEEYAQGKTR